MSHAGLSCNSSPFSGSLRMPTSWEGCGCEANRGRRSRKVADLASSSVAPDGGDILDDDEMFCEPLSAGPLCLPCIAIACPGGVLTARLNPIQGSKKWPPSATALGSEATAISNFREGVACRNTEREWARGAMAGPSNQGGKANSGCPLRRGLRSPGRSSAAMVRFPSSIDRPIAVLRIRQRSRRGSVPHELAVIIATSSCCSNQNVAFSELPQPRDQW
jgi:hypothetical protein